MKKYSSSPDSATCVCSIPVDLVPRDCFLVQLFLGFDDTLLTLPSFPFIQLGVFLLFLSHRSRERRLRLKSLHHVKRYLARGTQHLPFISPANLRHHTFTRKCKVHHSQPYKPPFHAPYLPTAAVPTRRHCCRRASTVSTFGSRLIHSIELHK